MLARPDNKGIYVDRDQRAATTLHATMPPDRLVILLLVITRYMLVLCEVL